MIGIYRARNANYVRDLIAPVRATDWLLAWWALDEVAPELADVTVGVGGGEKLPLLDEILRQTGLTRKWLVVADDDVVFTRGEVVGLTTICARARLDLAQPARSDTNVDHAITSSRRLSIARRTTFVEMGPLFVVGPDWLDRVVPFPEWRGMGWGLELDWLDLLRQGCRLGIVDIVRVRHEGVRGDGYDLRLYLQRTKGELADRGAQDWAELQKTLDIWRPWRRRPPWWTSPASIGDVVPSGRVGSDALQ